LKCAGSSPNAKQETQETAVQMMFNHPLMYVIDYPDENAVEMLDKRAGRMGYVQGEVAERFRHEFGIFLAEDRDEEQLEEFIDAHSAMLTLPASRH
jgi:hypothetical protein